MVNGGGRARGCACRGAERDAGKLVGNSSLYRPLRRHTGNARTARDRFTSVEVVVVERHGEVVTLVVPREAVLAWPARIARARVYLGPSSERFRGSSCVSSLPIASSSR